MTSKVQPLIERLLSKKDLEKHAPVLKAYDFYLQNLSILDRANIAMGQKQVFKTHITSTTLNP